MPINRARANSAATIRPKMRNLLLLVLWQVTLVVFCGAKGKAGKAGKAAGRVRIG